MQEYSTLGPLQSFPNYTVRPNGFLFIENQEFFCSMRAEIMNFEEMEKRIAPNYDKDKFLQPGIYIIKSTETKCTITKKQGVYFMRKTFEEGVNIIWEGKEIVNEEFIVKEEDILDQIRFGFMELLETISYEERNKKTKDKKTEQNRKVKLDKDQLNLF